MTPHAAIEAEQKRQADFIFTFKAGNAFFALGWLVLFANGWAIIPAAMMLAQAGYIAHTWPQLQADFSDAMERVAFLVNVEPLFVFSKSPDDCTVSERTEHARRMLREVGNEHECPIYSVVFRDVSAFRYVKGGLSIEPRPAGSSAETWPQYAAYCAAFSQEKREAWLRELRKNTAGAEWVNQNIFGQKLPEIWAALGEIHNSK